MLADVRLGFQQRAIGDLLRRKRPEALAILAGLRNDQLDGVAVKPDRRVIVILEINVDGNNSRIVERILAENFFFIAVSPEIRIGNDRKVLMRVARLQRHRIGRRRVLSLSPRGAGKQHCEYENSPKHGLAGYDAPSAE